MTLAPAVTAPYKRVPAPLPAAFTDLLAEALTGPARSGRVETVRVDGVPLDVAASRDWGLLLSRTAADGTTREQHLRGAALSVDGLTAAVRALLDTA